MQVDPTTEADYVLGEEIGQGVSAKVLFALLVCFILLMPRSCALVKSQHFVPRFIPAPAY